MLITVILIKKKGICELQQQQFTSEHNRLFAQARKIRRRNIKITNQLLSNRKINDVSNILTLTGWGNLQKLS